MNRDLVRDGFFKLEELERVLERTVRPLFIPFSSSSPLSFLFLFFLVPNANVVMLYLYDNRKSSPRIQPSSSPALRPQRPSLHLYGARDMGRVRRYILRRNRAWRFRWIGLFLCLSAYFLSFCRAVVGDRIRATFGTGSKRRY